jgi:glycerol-3-phosphate O-acyltransferase/dihydroxyacetone phosphate acyltransferase
VKTITGRLVYQVARFAVWIFYRVDRIGPRTPDGPALLVANHPNGLLDPALVWTTAGRPLRFLAKSTLFHGSLVSPLVRGSGAIPVYRRIDAGADMARNAEMFSAVEQALAQGDGICLFPEGISHSEGRLTELRTGAARIALASAAAGVRVALVPVGLTFSAMALFRSDATVAFGMPLYCDDLRDEYSRDAMGAARSLTERLARHLRGVMVEADPRSDAEVVERVDILYCVARRQAAGGAERLQRRRIIAAGIEELRARDPDRYQQLRLLLRRYDADLARFGLTDRDLDGRAGPRTATRFVLREALYASVLGPVALLGDVVFAVPYLLTDLAARRNPYLEDRATLKAVAGAVMYLGWTVALVALTGIFFGIAAAVGLGVLLPPFAVATLFARERERAVLRTVRAYLSVGRTPPAVRTELARRRNELADLLDRAEEWLREAPNGTQTVEDTTVT